MTKKLERVYRDRPLSPEEAARDQEIRRQVQAEFPPADRKPVSGRLSQALRDAIRASGKDAGQIAAEAGVAAEVVARFLVGERDIHMTTADKLADALGLRLAAAS